MPSSVKPSALEFSEARDQGVKDLKSPAYPFHQKEEREKRAQKVDSYEPDQNNTSDFPLTQESFPSRNVDYFYEKQTKNSPLDYDENLTKYSKFSEGFEYESKQDKPHTVYSFHQKEKREAMNYDLGLNTARNFSPTRGRRVLNEDRSPNVDSYYQSQAPGRAMSYGYLCDQDQIMKRKIDSFELNNFEDVKRSRQEELFFTKQSTSVIYESKQRYLKHSLPEKQQQPQLAPKYHQIEEQVNIDVVWLSQAFNFHFICCSYFLHISSAGRISTCV